MTSGGHAPDAVPATDGTPVLAFEGVEVAFGGRTVVGPVSLSVLPGRRLVLLGESGSGKSTLLRTAAGLVAPSRGRVRFAGEDVTHVSAPLLRRRMGFGLQSGGLFPHLTAAANVALLARSLGWAEGRIAARLEPLRALVRLAPDVLRRYPAELSGGQRQRVSLMRALMLEPALLLLDEPLGALDPITRDELQGELARVFREVRTTVVLVTHDIDEAARLGDSVALVREGRVLQAGTLEELVARPADPYVERFVRRGARA